VAATAERVRGGERRDVAKFLAAHERCASDFDIRRASDPADSRLSLVCNGCGRRAAYGAGQPGVLKELEGGGGVEGLAAAEVRVAKAPRKARPRKPSQAQVERWLPSPAALPWWVPNAYIVGVILIGLAMITFGLLRPGSDGRAVLGSTETTETTAQTPPPTITPPPVNNAGAAPAAAPEKPAPAREQAGPRTELDRTTVLDRFRIGVPQGWSRGTSDGAVLFDSPGDEAEVRVFLEPGDAGPRDLARRAAVFLRGEHPGATVTRPQEFRLSGDPAVWIEARYKGGSERAALLSESGYEYLLLRRVKSSARRGQKAAADAALQSFSAL
jgi:hypothetical protein